jgi:hypothetical protein
MDLKEQIRQTTDSIEKMEGEIIERKNWLKLLKKSLRSYEGLMKKAEEIKAQKPE